MKKAWFNPRTLFAASEPGAWYDPSDMSTLFQDSAGTVPVTAVEQPVGRILDKSGRGNHATQATTTKRPTYSRRVNVLLNTETQSAWSYQGSRFTAGATDGTGAALLTASVQNSTLSGVHTDYPIGTSYAQPACIVRSIEVKGGTATNFKFGSASNFINLRLSDGVVEAINNVPVYTVTQTSDGYWRIAIYSDGASFVASTLSNYIAWGMGRSGNDISTVDQIGTTVYVRRPSYVVKEAGFRGEIPYQRVNTATDYDADPDKFPAYRRADGVDDSLASSTGGGGTTGFFFSSAISPQGSAGTARTLFSDAGTNTGYIVRLNASNQLELSAGNGTAYTTIATVGTLAVSATDVVQAWDDGTTLNVKIGSGPTASIARPVVVAGTAGYTLHQDNGASTGYFNGRSYGEIYRKDSGLTQSQREAVAVFQRQKARIA